MKTSQLVTTIVAVVFWSSIFAQDPHRFKGPVLYAEYGGASSFLTLNVEYMLVKLPRSYVSGRMGYGYMIIDGYERSGAPVSINLFRFSGSHHAEVGVGISYIEGIERYYRAGEERWNRGLYGFGSLGYRYQRPKGGLFFKALWHPMFQLKEYNPDPYFIVGTTSPYWFGLSAGYFISREKQRDKAAD